MGRSLSFLLIKNGIRYFQIDYRKTVTIPKESLHTDFIQI